MDICLYIHIVCYTVGSGEYLLYIHIVCYTVGSNEFLFVHTYSMLYSGQW